ncbi:MAG: alcohol dehydrogenase catalytic domain-containing protein [Caldilinea sp.]|nr:alcohol dehydrogenase catalytic domain-containing protein [Caldilinea sp.]MDW8442680.1 alcohol dehydrogenase catalytic domain-containing protein [Caldilineaceae bacterium]
MHIEEPLPPMMETLVWLGPRCMEMQLQPTPTPGQDEVLVEVTAVGVCGSELSGYLGRNSLRRPPLVMGHEFGGRIVRVGGGALANGEAPSPGRRVVVNPLIGCGACRLCCSGLPNLCPHRQIIGAHRPGAFARYVCAPAAQCWPLSDVVSDWVAALVEPLACALRGVHHVQWQPEKGPLLILGAGPIGLFCLAVAHQEQPEGAILVSDRIERRLQQAQQWGASATVDGGDAAERDLRSLLPEGAAAVIDAVGSDATRKLAVQLVQPGGCVLFIGLHDESSPLEANYLVRQEIVIRGSFAYTPADFAAALGLLETGLIAPAPTWLEERPLHEGAQIFAGLIDGAITTPKVILRP